MKIVKEEIFGPVLVVIKFITEQGSFPIYLYLLDETKVCPTSFTEVIEAANATEYGLACHIFTENVSRAVRVAHAVEAGLSWVGPIFCFSSRPGE